MDASAICKVPPDFGLPCYLHGDSKCKIDQRIRNYKIHSSHCHAIDITPVGRRAGLDSETICKQISITEAIIA